MAIIKDIKVGYIDHAGVGVSFSVNGEGWGAGVHLSFEEVAEWLKENYIDDIKTLNGKPCIVEIDENRTVNFKRFLKI